MSAQVSQGIELPDGERRVPLGARGGFVAAILLLYLAIPFPVPLGQDPPGPTPDALPPAEVLFVQMDAGANRDQDPDLHITRWWINHNDQLSPSRLAVYFERRSQEIGSGTQLRFELINSVTQKVQPLACKGNRQPRWVYEIQTDPDFYELGWPNCRVDTTAGRAFMIRVTIPALNTSAMTDSFVLQPMK